MRKAIIVIVLIIFGGLGGYIYWFYYNEFGNGYREGILYSFNRRGNVFKTYEGVVLQPGLRPLRQGGLNTNEFYFSVTDEQLADTLKKCTGMQIKVHYKIFRKHLPWRGENYNNVNKDKGQYIIDRVESVKEVDSDTYNNI